MTRRPSKRENAATFELFAPLARRWCHDCAVWVEGPRCGRCGAVTVASQRTTGPVAEPGNAARDGHSEPDGGETMGRTMGPDHD